MQAAGITKDTKEPAGGRIERDAEGNPSGVLVDKAMDLSDRVRPDQSDGERRDALRAAPTFPSNPTIHFSAYTPQ